MRIVVLCVVFLSVANLCSAFTLSVEGHLDSLQADAHLFGVKPDALIGQDGWDVPEPPTSPSNYLALALTMPDAEASFPNRWRNEFRPYEVFEDNVEIWELAIESDHAGQIATLNIHLADGDPSELEIFVLGPWGRDRTEFPVALEVPLATDRETIWVEVHWDSPVANKVQELGTIKVWYR